MEVRANEEMQRGERSSPERVGVAHAGCLFPNAFLTEACYTYILKLSSVAWTVLGSKLLSTPRSTVETRAPS